MHDVTLFAETDCDFVGKGLLGLKLHENLGPHAVRGLAPYKNYSSIGSSRPAAYIRAR